MSEQQESRGERRRRRQAQEEARRAAEAAGEVRVTRKEMRRRALEEQARLEAIATGELPLVGEDGRQLAPEEALRLAGAAARDARPAQPDQGDQPAQPDQADQPEQGNQPNPVDQTGQPGSADRRPAQRAVVRRPVVRTPPMAKGVRMLDSTGTITGIQPVTAAGPEPAPAAPRTGDVPRPGSAPESEVSADPVSWESAVSLPVVPDDEHTIRVEDHLTEHTSEPEATPTTEPEDEHLHEHADRTADETRSPGSEPRTATGGFASPRWSAVSASSPDAVSELDRTVALPPVSPRSAGSARSATSSPEAYAAAALAAEDDDDAPLRPNWSPVSGFTAASGSSPDEAEATTGRRARREPAPRRSVRDRVAAVADAVSAASAAEAEDEAAYVEEMRPRNPAASVVRIVALVLAAVIIGLLIGLLAFRDPAGAAEAGAAAAAVMRDTAGGTGSVGVVTVP